MILLTPYLNDFQACNSISLNFSSKFVSFINLLFSSDCKNNWGSALGLNQHQVKIRLRHHCLYLHHALIPNVEVMVVQYLIRDDARTLQIASLDIRSAFYFGIAVKQSYNNTNNSLRHFGDPTITSAIVNKSIVLSFWAPSKFRNSRHSNFMWDPLFVLVTDC